MSTPNEAYDRNLVKYLDQLNSLSDLESNEATTAMKNLKTFSECRPPAPEPEPTPEAVPTTVWGKVQAGASAVWDNETTRVLIKAGGAFAGVALVVWSTVHRDHVVDRQALAQANQKS